MSRTSLRLILPSVSRLVLAAAAAAAGLAACAAPAPADWPAIRAELARRTAEEQELRGSMLGGAFDPGLAERVMAADASNRAWLRTIVDAHGWPQASQVGREGASQAWLLAQHADADVDFQERCLRLLRAAVAAGEADPQNLAYLEDRVAVNRGRAQTYGTQFHEVEGELVPQPIEDPARVDERRAAVGLGPLTEYAELMRGLSGG